MDSLYYKPSSPSSPSIPFVSATSILINGVLREYEGTKQKVLSPIRLSQAEEGKDEIVIGEYSMCDTSTALEAVESAEKAYNYGRGSWPRMNPLDRIHHVRKFASIMKEKREELVAILMWEICKNRSDAEKEVDRTVDYIHDTIRELARMENHSNGVTVEQGIVAQVKRSPLGVALVAGPMNYPLNEFATLFIPAVIMGNTVVMKTPRTGGLVHIPLLTAYRDCFPPGVVNVLHGSGREVFTPIMKSGKVNILAFIGTHQAAQQLHTIHPRPFTVRLALGLDAKNPAIVTSNADLDVAASEIILGALSFNGQRCTAIKIIFVHESIADELVQKLSYKMDQLIIGLPWEKGVQITPICDPAKPKYFHEVIEDAISKGAQVINQKGKQFDRTFCSPTLLYPCNLSMRIAKEEQFGPVVPVVRYSHKSELDEYFVHTEYGQQAALFTRDSKEIPDMIDFLAHHVTRINLNAQCQRGPDSMPFSGRKVSASGTLSLWDALRTMSIRVAVATKHTDENVKLFTEVFRTHESNVLSSDVLITKI